jgi:hypothetical protein
MLPPAARGRLPLDPLLGVSYKVLRFAQEIPQIVSHFEAYTGIKNPFMLLYMFQ